MAINNLLDGKRVSTARAYLTPEVRRRPNLAIMSTTQALAIRFDSNRAVGVMVRDATGERMIDRGGVNAHLLAGAFQVSGAAHAGRIGPGDHLRENGIAVLSDRPGVGPISRTTRSWWRSRPS